jgi:outer membrane protein assembly factor BamE
MKIMRNSLVIWYCFIAVILSACSGVKFSEWRFPYMYPVQQGNYVTEQQLSQLKVGMTKDQVSFVIGHPVTQFMFNSQQWQYMFQQFRNDKLRNSYIVNINFESDIMRSVESAGQVFIK